MLVDHVCEGLFLGSLKIGSKWIIDSSIKQNTIKSSIFIDKILIMTQNLVNNSKI